MPRNAQPSFSKRFPKDCNSQLLGQPKDFKGFQWVPMDFQVFQKIPSLSNNES